MVSKHIHDAALRVTGDRLLALTEFLGTYTVEQVRAGLWRKLSGGMYLNPRRMKELTVTPFPVVGTAHGPEGVRPGADPPEDGHCTRPAADQVGPLRQRAVAGRAGRRCGPDAEGEAGGTEGAVGRRGGGVREHAARAKGQ